jgi:hypothetical protein
MTRIVVRIAAIALAAALFIGLTTLYADSIRPPRDNRFQRRDARRRPPEGQLSRFPSVAQQFVLVVFAGFAGRKVLRLRI